MPAHFDIFRKVLKNNDDEKENRCKKLSFCLLAQYFLLIAFSAIFIVLTNIYVRRYFERMNNYLL